MRQTIEILRYVNMAATCLIAVACLYQWRRYRSEPARWAAVAFGSLGAITVIGMFLTRGPNEALAGWHIKLLLAVLVCFPYMLYRFAASFEFPGRLVTRIANVTTAIVVAGAVSMPYLPAEGQPRPAWFTPYLVLLISQWSFLFIVVGVRLWRAGRGQPTVPRRRMRLLAVGTMSMNLSVLVGQAVAGGDPSVARLMVRMLTLSGSAMLFIGLAPPAWVLHLWRRPETREFQRAMGDLISAPTLERLGQILLPPSVHLIGARGGRLLATDGQLIGSYGVTDESSSITARRVEMRSGTLVLYANAYTPFFGRGELEMSEALGRFADLAMERFVLADSQRESEEALAFQARHDALTGLPNRVMFMHRLTVALGRMSNGTAPALTVQFLDLDRFKMVNDGIDHAAGDKLLIAVAERLRESVREQDTVARFGGDEFVVLAEVADQEEASALAERVHASFAPPFLIAGRELNVSASLGLVVVNEGREADSILRDADTAMYRAKDAGRARVVLFDDALRDQSAQRLDMERSLRSAVADDTLRLHYQPTVRLSDGAAVGVEALFRWQHPRLGLLEAASLIEMAEESDLIAVLGGWVLREACAQAQHWRQNVPGLEDVKVWVNVSPAQFTYRDVAQDTADALRETGLDPAGLGLEITETVFVEETLRMQEAFAALKALGVQVAIDDFGTGYSSLGALKRFPANVLKIDGSFVMGLGRDPQDAAIVTACLALGDAMGLTVIAEAVETDDQRCRLMAMGCEFGQGYYFSPALPSAAAEAYLRAHPADAPDEAPPVRRKLELVPREPLSSVV